MTFSDCFDFLICSRLRLKKRTCPDFRNINSRSFVFKDEFRGKNKDMMLVFAVRIEFPGV